MAKIFISYRREDSIAWAGRLYDHLAGHFGADEVFMDIGGIAPGEDFVRVLDGRIAESDVVIALIGPRWLTAADEHGRRIDRADDFVRHELAAALRLGKRLIPVLVGGAPMPPDEDLPAVLAGLARCQAREVDDARFAYDVGELIRAIEGKGSLLDEVRETERMARLRRWRHAGAAGVALAMLFVGWIQLFDALGLDTRIESVTMALGDVFADVPVSERIALVTFDEKTEGRLGKPGPAWRGEHAHVIDRLSEAGAKVIALDLFFERPGPADAELIEAVGRARQRGSQVFVGVRRLADGAAAVIPGLGEAASGPGLLCIGGRIGYASVAPLAVVKTAGETSGSGKFFSLAMLAAGAETLTADDSLRQATVGSGQGKTLWQGPLARVAEQVEASGKLSDDCPLLAPGDRVASAMIRVAAAAAWRDPARRFDYEQVAGPAGGFAAERLRGRIVIVGDARPGEDEFRIMRGLHAERRYGVELHADVLNNLVQGMQVRRPGSAPQFLLMLLMSAAGGWLRVGRPAMARWPRRLLAVAVVLAYLAATILVYAKYGLLLNTAYHVGAFVIAYWLLGRLSARRPAIPPGPRGGAGAG